MYIKSQDRSLIVNTDCIFIGDMESSKTKIFARKNNSNITLGTYCCNDRAQEVFDTICDRLEDGMDFIESDNGQNFKRHMIFEMPIK